MTTFTEMTEYHVGTDGTVYITDSYTPTANRGLLAFVNASGTVAATPTGAGNGLSWTRDFRIVWHGGADILCIYSALTGSSPTAGGFTFNCTGDSATGCTIHVVEIDGCDLVDFIGQIVSGSGGVGEAPATTFSPAIAVDSAVYHAFGVVGSPPPNIDAPSGYTRLMNSGHTQPGISSGAAVHSSPGAVTTVTWADLAAFSWAAVGVEILAPSGSTPIVEGVNQITEAEQVQDLTVNRYLDPTQVAASEVVGAVIGYRVSDFSSTVSATYPVETIFGVVPTVIESGVNLAPVSHKTLQVAQVLAPEAVVGIVAPLVPETTPTRGKQLTTVTFLRHVSPVIQNPVVSQVSPLGSAVSSLTNFILGNTSSLVQQNSNVSKVEGGGVGVGLQIGDAVRISTEFRDFVDVLTDPTTVTLKIKVPTGGISTYTYPATVIKDSTGKYHKDITLNESGGWSWRWEGTGTITTADEGYFTVDVSVF